MSGIRDAWWDLVHGVVCLCCSEPGRLLCPDCADALPRQSLRVRPAPCPPGLAPCFAAGEYADPLRALLLAHKERRAFSLARPLGEVLAEVIAGVAPSLVVAPILLVPVPSRPVVVRARGHDPMLRVSRAASARLRSRALPATSWPILRQRLRVCDQAGLGADARADNLADSIRVDPSARAALVRRGTAARVVICDDVLTTGATAREAQRALEDAGVRVAVIATIAATRRRCEQSLPFSPPAH